MPLYHVPATGSPEDYEGIRPDFGTLEVKNWSGIYDEVSHSYIIRTPEEEPVPELHVEDPAAPSVNFDYSALVAPVVEALPAEGESEKPQPEVPAS